MEGETHLGPGSPNDRYCTARAMSAEEVAETRGRMDNGQQSAIERPLGSAVALLPTARLLHGSAVGICRNASARMLGPIPT